MTNCATNLFVLLSLKRVGLVNLANKRFNLHKHYDDDALFRLLICSEKIVTIGLKILACLAARD